VTAAHGSLPTTAGIDLHDWFLTTDERGNPNTAIDQGRGSRAWTDGNEVTVLIDGVRYFPELLRELRATRAGDSLFVADLQSDGDERLEGSGTEIGTVLADAARRGVDVRGLLWRSHPAGHAAAEVTNTLLSRTVNDAGGQFLLDHRVRRGGSHHQKIVVVEHDPTDTSDAPRDVAFAGGMDLAHGRHDGPRHTGDPQTIRLGDSRYGNHPPWHDVQVRIRGPAVGDVACTFRERWEDPSPLENPSPWRALRRYIGGTPTARDTDLPSKRPQPRCGTQAVQVLRTYPARRQPYPFAEHGERSVARAYVKAFGQARSFIYIEDQYLWSLDATRALCAALRARTDLRCVIVIPRFPDPDGVLGSASRFGRWRVERALRRAGGERVQIFDLENEEGTPIYVHAKVCIVDDVWMTVGSDNLNRRSCTHDSEICCAVVDTDGDLVRATRLQLMGEHLAMDDERLTGLEAPDEWAAALRISASALDAWHAAGGAGPRPPGHLRVHPRDRVPVLLSPVLHFLHAWLLDPDGRPRRLRRRGRY
jgi:phosphatidylserine/phosphatidylglycerophosphate/cardiolipin synthase-like enzyme